MLGIIIRHCPHQHAGSKHHLSFGQERKFTVHNERNDLSLEFGRKCHSYHLRLVHP